MTEEEMMEWYKNGAQRQESMSDKDYELYKGNALYAQKNQLLDSNLATQQAGLAKAKTSAQQSASIGYDKLNRYLQKSQLASGMATGQTGTNFINASNAYQQNRAAINNNYSAQQADLLQRYAGEKLQVGSDAHNAETAINDKYYDRNMTLEQWAYGKERDKVADEQQAWQNDMTLKQWENTLAQQDLEQKNTDRDNTYADALDDFYQYMGFYLKDEVIDDEEYNAAKAKIEQFRGYLPDRDIQALINKLDIQREINRVKKTNSNANSTASVGGGFGGGGSGGRSR